MGSVEEIEIYFFTQISNFSNIIIPKPKYILGSISELLSLLQWSVSPHMH